MVLQNNESTIRYQAAMWGDLAIVRSGNVAFLCDVGEIRVTFGYLGRSFQLHSLNFPGYPLLFKTNFGSLPYF